MTGPFLQAVAPAWPEAPEICTGHQTKVLQPLLRSWRVVVRPIGMALRQNVQLRISYGG